MDLSLDPGAAGCKQVPQGQRSGMYRRGKRNLTLDPGVAGVQAGAGKSSVVSALLRLAETQDGRITVDGLDIRSVPLPRLRAAIGVVPQAPFLFEARSLVLSSSQCGNSQHHIFSKSSSCIRAGPPGGLQGAWVAGKALL